jgi:hypothetical protein
MNKQPWQVRVLLSLGILMATMPLLFKEYIPIPDFLHGAIEGVGIGLEISGLVLMRRNRKCNSSDTLSSLVPQEDKSLR